LRIDSAGTRQVHVRVDEARAAYVHPGDTADVQIDGEPGPGEKALEGTIAEVARAVGADQRAFTVKVTLPRTVTARSGTFARVIFRGASRRALLVPANAVRQHGQVASVYVVQEGVARLRLIQLGASFPKGVEVLAGLDVGESVVTSPGAGVVDGARVAVTAARNRTGATP
jgi:cobalt-zinc-cadmium efflux system membrane fusion protein